MKYSPFNRVSLRKLVKYIEGSSSSDETQKIEKWVDAEPKNLKFLNNLRNIWPDKKILFSLRKEVVQKDYAMVLEKIEDTRRKAEKKFALKRIWMRVAAGILLIITTLFAYHIGRSYKISSLSENYTHINVPKGQRSQITLSDGTSVWLNADSKMYFTDQFNRTSRDIWLEGEAYFEVTKNASVPFNVHTGDLTIKVHGTRFNVKAYPAENYIETTLLEGAISIGLPGRQDDYKVLPEQKVTYSRLETTFVTENLLNAGSVILWTDGKLIFENETFEEILVKLERKYNVNMIVEDNVGAIKNAKYTGILKNVSLEQALKAIQKFMPISFAIEEDTVIISRK